MNPPWTEVTVITTMAASGVVMVWGAYCIRKQASRLTLSQYCDRQDTWVRHGVIALSVAFLASGVVAVASREFDVDFILFMIALYLLLIGPGLKLSLEMAKALIFTTDSRGGEQDTGRT